MFDSKIKYINIFRGISAKLYIYTVGRHKYSHTYLFIIYYTSSPPRCMKLSQNIDFNTYIKIIKENINYKKYIDSYITKTKIARDKSIQTPHNLQLIFGCEAFIHYYCLETVLIWGNQTFTNIWWNFPPFFNADFSQFGQFLKISLMDLVMDYVHNVLYFPQVLIID